MTLGMHSGRVKQVYGKLDSDLLIVDYIEKLDGTPVLPTDTVRATVRQDFDPYEFFKEPDNVTTSVFVPTINDPLKGTPTNPDRRWNPAQNDNEGYNMELKIERERWIATGKYRCFVVFDDVTRIYEINISD